MLAQSTLLFLSLGVVFGSSVQLTYPKANAVFKAGSTVHIKWKVNDAKTGPIRLQYASGKATSLNVDGVIADNVTASVGSYAWTIPHDIKANKYVIEAGPNAKDLSFAGYVNIQPNATKTAKKPQASKKAVCVGYPSKKNASERVRCHSVPEAASVKKGNKKLITTRPAKKSLKTHPKKTKKATKKAKVSKQ